MKAEQRRLRRKYGAKEGDKLYADRNPAPAVKKKSSKKKK